MLTPLFVAYPLHIYNWLEHLEFHKLSHLVLHLWYLPLSMATVVSTSPYSAILSEKKNHFLHKRSTISIRIISPWHFCHHNTVKLMIQLHPHSASFIFFDIKVMFSFSWWPQLLCLAGVSFFRTWRSSILGTRIWLTGRSTSPNAGSSSTSWTACGASSKCTSAGMNLQYMQRRAWFWFTVGELFHKSFTVDVHSVFHYILIL